MTTATGGVLSPGRKNVSASRPATTIARYGAANCEAAPNTESTHRLRVPRQETTEQGEDAEAADDGGENQPHVGGQTGARPGCTGACARSHSGRAAAGRRDGCPRTRADRRTAGLLSPPWTPAMNTRALLACRLLSPVGCPPAGCP